MSDRRAIATIAAHVRWAQADGRAATQGMRDKYRASFRVSHECALCPLVAIDQALPEAEIARRAENLRRAHYGRLARRSAKRRKVATR
jgi:hypothetical protein